MESTIDRTKVASNEKLLEAIRYFAKDDANRVVEALVQEIETNGMTFAERELMSRVLRRIPNQ